MNQQIPDSLWNLLLPLLNDPQALDATIDKLPLNPEEKNTIRQVLGQVQKQPGSFQSPQSLEQVIQGLMQQLSPEQLQTLAPLIDQLANLTPEHLMALQLWLRFNK